VGEHINTKHNGLKRHKKGFSESHDVRAQRAARVSFKTYMNSIENDLLEQELSESEWVLERGVRDGDETNWVEIDTFKTEEEADAELDKCYENNLHNEDSFRVREV
jgi:hypothetical protein